jgi:hypothetical protein
MPITLTSKLEELILRDQVAPQVANTSENEAKGQSIPVTNGLDPFSEESIQFGSLDTTLEELGRRSPPLPTSPPPEPQQTVSWRWGALPKVRYWLKQAIINNLDNQETQLTQIMNQVSAVITCHLTYISRKIRQRDRKKRTKSRVDGILVSYI